MQAIGGAELETLILGPNNSLSGPRVVTTRIRPRRVSFLVPPDDVSVTLRVIDSCCLTWGGMLNSIIPYSPAEGLTPDWEAVLNTFDPDLVIDCSGLSTADKERFEKRNQRVSRWSEPHASLLIPGALLYSALNAFVPKPPPN